MVPLFAGFSSGATRRPGTARRRFARLVCGRLDAGHTPAGAARPALIVLSRVFLVP
jgi:hypothetical protein